MLTISITGVVLSDLQSSPGRPYQQQLLLVSSPLQQRLSDFYPYSRLSRQLSCQSCLAFVTRLCVTTVVDVTNTGSARFRNWIGA